VSTDRPRRFRFPWVVIRHAVWPCARSTPSLRDDFDLVAQMAAPGDPTDDATALWPPERERIALGAIEVTGARADQAEERSPFFNPNNLPDGIAQSDDPLLPARQQSYGVAGARRSAD
jgi:catalase